MSKLHHFVIGFSQLEKLYPTVEKAQKADIDEMLAKEVVEAAQLIRELRKARLCFAIERI